ncbi:hypothetical protein K490DRAFT_64022 [Saccharata proteae CBS 121410]|uniref:Uncharacterized protein n=1 Tax=Saccharata proteae CBS 121410 TaxID=1314787 RepID=A0A6A5YB16_9PEZI|nr:hypothetical protein K490DRAFT_64022 [Saccharata proteae CBS 121410]
MATIGNLTNVTIGNITNAMVGNAENNLFYLDGYRNGSLFDQRYNGSQIWYDPVAYPDPYPGNDHDQLVDISILHDNLAALIFNASLLVAPKRSKLSYSLDDSEVILESVLPLARTILDGTVDRIPVACMYPLSGQYDTLVRSLFYILLVASLLFRRHNWLATAALGSAMTYAATSAIHLFILLAKYRFDPLNELFSVTDAESATKYGDPDIFGIFPILAFSAVMVTPVLNWSSTVRKSKAQPVVIYWGILIIAALIPATIYMSRCLYTSWTISGSTWVFDKSLSYIACQPGCIDGDELLSAGDFSRCDCTDFCPLISPKSPLRRGGNMVAILSEKLSLKTQDSSTFLRVWKVSLAAVAMVLAQLIFSILTGGSSQVEVRAWVFEFLNGDGEQQKKLLQKTRQILAAFLAGSLYVGAIFIAVLCPLIGVLTIVLNELLIQSIPRSEHSDAVGAWASWVGTGFVITAGLIIRYHESWWTTVIIGLETIWLKYAYARDKENKDFEQLGNSRLRGNPRQLRSRVKTFFEEVISPFVHLWTAIRVGIWVLKANTRFFLDWCKNPVDESRFGPIELEKRWLKRPEKPQCKCAMCGHAWDQRADRDEVDEIEAIISKRVQRYNKRVKQWLGDGYEVVKTEDAIPSQGHGQQQDDALEGLVKYSRKRVKRRVGSGYDIVRVGERELDTLRSRSDDTISPSMTSTEQQQHRGSISRKPVPSVHRSPS